MQHSVNNNLHVLGILSKLHDVRLKGSILYVLFCQTVFNKDLSNLI